MKNINALRDAIRFIARATAGYAARNTTPYRSAVLIYLALVLQSHLSVRAISSCPIAGIDRGSHLASPETRMYAAAASAVGRARSRSRSGSVSAYVL